MLKKKRFIRLPCSLSSGQRSSVMVKYAQTTPTKTIPNIREYPLIGSFPAFMRDRLNFLLYIAQEGDVCSFHIGPVPIVLFNKPEHVQSVLVEHADDFYK